jgi:hypothetical protein
LCGSSGSSISSSLSPAREKNPDAARAADVEVAVAIDLDAVDGVLARRVGHVVEDLAGADRVARGVELVAHHDLALEVPVADVQVALIRREREAVGPAELVANERDGDVADLEDAAERKLLGRVVERVGQPEGRVVRYSVPPERYTRSFALLSRFLGSGRRARWCRRAG